MADVSIKTAKANGEAQPGEPEMTPEGMKSTVVEMIKGIQKGPRAVQMYMEMCAKCGVCAASCPVYYGSPEKSLNPAERTDIIRRIYKKYCTTSGKLLGKMAGAEDFNPDDIEQWVAANKREHGIAE